MSIDKLPPLREVIERHDLMPKKSLGQNFLFDLNLTSKIARQAGDLKDQPVIEVGPGPGGLTRALLAQGAYVTAIERDERCLEALAEIEAQYPGRLRIISGDALEQDFKTLFPDGPKPRIVSNLPYNVGTQLLLNWLLSEPWPPFYSSMTLMFQREVAERIVAAAVEHLALALPGLQALLDPQIIVIGGGIGLATGFVPRLEATLSRFPSALRPSLALARLGADAGLLGAADLLNRRALLESDETAQPLFTGAPALNV